MGWGEAPVILSLSLIMLIVGYFIRFMATGFNAVEVGFEKVGTKYLEASRMLGQGMTKTFFKVDLPLLKGWIISGFVLTFVEICKELPLALLGHWDKPALLIGTAVLLAVFAALIGILAPRKRLRVRRNRPVRPGRRGRRAEPAGCTPVSILPALIGSVAGRPSWRTLPKRPRWPRGRPRGRPKFAQADSGRLRRRRRDGPIGRAGVGEQREGPPGDRPRRRAGLSVPTSHKSTG